MNIHSYHAGESRRHHGNTRLQVGVRLSKQNGMITLSIVMVILLLAAMITIYTANTSVKEQEVTADQFRSEQAFAAAQAGVDEALHRHNNFEDWNKLDADGNPIFPESLTSPHPETTIEEQIDSGSYRTMFCDIWDDDDDVPDKDSDEDGITSVLLMEAFLADVDNDKCTYPINPDESTTDTDGFLNDTRVGILSFGQPDDKSGRRTITVVSAPARITGGEGPPLQPLVARSTVDVTGTMRVVNRYTNATVWSGKSLGTMGNMQTYVNDNENTLDPATDRLELISLDPSADDPTIFENSMQASGKFIGNNSDVIDKDYNLNGLSDQELFKGFFAASMATIKNTAEVITDLSQLNPSGNPEDASGLLWVDDPDLKAQIPSLGNCLVDDPTPVILVVEVPAGGKLKFSGNTVICGIVFVFGDVDATVGGFTVYGAMIATGALDLGAGTADIVFDPEAIAEPPEGFKRSRGIDAGTWKDWGWTPET